MKISEKYIHLKDRITYNQFYALKYPEEDRTTLEHEYQEVMNLFADLMASLASADTLEKLDLAAREVKDAFALFHEGQDGYHKMEKALELIDSSRLIKSAVTNFIAGAQGTVKRHH